MSAIDQKYNQLGGSSSFLGNPKTEERVCPDGVGHYRHYDYGSIYWHPDTGAHEVHGANRARWSSLGWERSFLGYPKTDETETPDEAGRYNHFQGGSIYWHPDTGAYEVHGSIRHKWSALGWEKSFLGYPLTNETPTPDTKGRYNHFQGGSIYWYPGIGAFEVHGSIRHKWATLGWERSFLGYPKTDEKATPDGVGRYNHFEHGSIYWHPNTGAHEVHGSIRNMWSWNGWEKRIGYPKTDETSINQGDNGRYNEFQKGAIGWTPDQGAWFDFTGTGEGKFSGNIRLYKNSNYDGTNHNYPLSTNEPVIFKQDLSKYGLNDNVSSLRLNGILETCSVYLYQHPKWNGRYIRITGKQNGGQYDLSSVGEYINNKISSVQAVNHGKASVVMTANQLQILAADQVANINVPDIKWEGSPSVSLVPGERAIKIRVEGVVESTWPDSEVKIDIYFHPYVAGERLVKVNLARWWAHSGGSFGGYANSTILGTIKKYFKNNSASLANSLNTVLADKLSKLNEVPDFAREAINVRRVNILPEGFEIVLSDTDIGATLLQTANVDGLSAARPQGQKTQGSV